MMTKIMMIMMMNDKDSDDEDYDGDDGDDNDDANDDDNNSDDIDDDGDWEVVRNTDCASVGVQIATRPIVRYTRCRLGIHNLPDNNMMMTIMMGFMMTLMMNNYNSHFSLRSYYTQDGGQRCV